MPNFAKIVYTLIGWIYLWIRYRNKEKVKNILKSKYENQYSNAGAIFVWSVFGVILMILLVTFLVVVIIGIIKNSFN